MTLASIFKPFVSFRMAHIIGIIMAAWLFLTQSETQPISIFLTGMQIYLIAFFVVLGYRLSVWVIIEKASPYNITTVLSDIVIDYIICILSLFGALSFLFLLTTFLI